MNKIEFKDFAKHCFIDSIKTAKYQADTVLQEIAMITALAILTRA